MPECDNKFDEKTPNGETPNDTGVKDNKIPCRLCKSRAQKNWGYTYYEIIRHCELCGKEWRC